MLVTQSDLGRPGSHERGATLIEVLVTCFIISLLLGMTMAAMQAAREASRRSHCANNLRMIGLAMHNYLSAENYFPPIMTHTYVGRSTPWASAHSYSPLARMLPQLEQAAIFNATNFTNIPDFPVGVIQNLTVMIYTTGLFLCPSDTRPAVLGFGRASYRFSVGPTHTLAPGSSKPESFMGPFTTHYVYRAADFHDGLSNTVGTSERLLGDWTSGLTKARGDYYLTTPRAQRVFNCDAAVAVCAGLPGDAAVESRGGESWFLSGFHFTSFNHCVPPNSQMKDCALDDDKEPLHARLIHAGVFAASSYHSAGVNVGLMDGSVRFIRNSIAPNIWRAIGTRSGGEVVSIGD